MKRILVIAESIDVNDSSGTKGRVALIKNMIKQNNYQEVVMLGISGGGWYTTLLSSVITEIEISYSFAGTMPLLFRLFDTNYGDWEQIDSSLYNKVD